MGGQADTCYIITKDTKVALINRLRLVYPIKASRGISIFGMATKKIGTHDGKFHCDEALACHLLRILPEYKNSDIVRSRDPALLSTCDVVVDVGGVFDPASHRYDHHQREFTESMASLNPDYPWTTKLSSAGLVYAHFGHRIIAKLLSTEVDTQLVQVAFRKVYE